MSPRKPRRAHADARPPRRAAGSHASAESPASSLPPTALVTIKELSRYLNVSRSTLWKLVHSGQVPHVRVGNQYRFDVVAVRGAMERFT